MTQIKIMQCPSSPNPNRFQDKYDANESKRKVGATTDYFPPEGLAASFAAELSAQWQPALGTSADLLMGVLRPVPEQSPERQRAKRGNSITEPR